MPVPAVAAALALGAALATVAFAARGGSELSRTTVVEIALIVVGGGAAALAVAAGPSGRLHGGLSGVLLGVLAALTVLSVLWSVAPELSWIEANRTLAYLAVFAAGLALARLAPDAQHAVLGGLLIAVTAILAYALLSRIFPADLAADETYARIGEPYGYWNAVGVTAALGVPPALWLGARRSGHPLVAALAYPLLGAMIVALFLTVSRGAVVAAAVGIALWLAHVPLRLRSLVVLGVAALGSLPVIAWALSQPAFTDDLATTAVRQEAAAGFALFLALTFAGLFGAGAAVGALRARRTIAESARRRAGIATAAVAGVLALAAVGSVALSERGLAGTISDRVKELTSETATTPGGADRLTRASSTRGRYWRQAGRIFADRPLLGAGAGSFSVARLRHRRDQLVARRAHGYVAQTMADLGLAGLLIVLLLAGSWLVGAARNTGVRPRAPDLAEHPRRLALVALALSVVVFGVHSAVDWTWFVPGPAVMAIAVAGFIAGRGPYAASEPPAQPGGALGTLTERLRTADRRGIVLATSVLVVAGLCAWAVWQPERAERRSDEALRLADGGQIAAARAKARAARDINPLATGPLFVQSVVEDAAGRPAEAARLLERAVVEHRNDPQAWLRLADFRLRRLGQAGPALEAARGALYLDPQSRITQSTFLVARQRAAAETATGP